ncbi:MAG: glycosyltransferase family 39 protein [bacterium]
MWSTHVDGQYSMYVYGPPLLLAAACVVGAIFGYEAIRRRLAIPRPQAGVVLFAAAAASAALAAVIVAVGPGTPAWELSVSGRFSAGLVHTIALPFAWLVSFPFALFGLFALFLWAARRGRWPEAYFALVAGPGLAAVLVVLKVVYPRLPPAAQPFFTGATSFPNDGAALLPGLVLLALFLVARLRPGSRRHVPWLVAAGVAGVAGPILAGVAWPTDALAGCALAVAWFALSLMGFHLTQLATADSALGRLDATASRILERPVPWLAGLVGLGVVLRIASYWWTPLAVDSYAYSAMAHSFVRHGGTDFAMPWGDVHTFLTAQVPSHHYPPLYPLYLAGFFEVLGVNAGAVHVASIVSSLAAMVVTYACTRDLYGPRQGLVAVALVAVSPILVQNTGQGYSENLVLALFVATLWAILKSLERPWYIVPAGILAGLGYLTKSTMGPFFIIAGLGGLAWRLHWKGWKVLRDPAYVTAILAFGSLVAIWAIRNILLFGSWDTSLHITNAYHAALSHPLQWAYLFLVTLVFYATAGYLVYLALLPWLPRLASIPKLKSEHDSGLWLALGLPLLLTAAIDACLWLVEGEFFVNNVRYIAFVAVPAVWLLMRHASPKDRAVRLATLVTVVLLVTGSLYFAKPSTSYTQALADELGPRLHDGDSVAFVDNDNHFAYRFYFQLTDNGRRDVPVVIACSHDALAPPRCPETAADVGSLSTTWVLVPHYAEHALPAAYHQVLDTWATADDAHPTLMTIWHHE